MRNLDRILQLEDTQREALITSAKRHMLKNGEGPKTITELHQCIQALFGVSIPTTATTEDVESPLEFMWAMYSHKYPLITAIGPRDGGKTFMVSKIGAPLKGAFQPNMKMAHTASVLAQTEVALNYLKESCEDPVISTTMNLEDSTTKHIRWFNGAEYKVLTGNARGVSGQHPPCLILDETEFMDISTLEQAFGVPSPRYGYDPLFCAVSTRQSAAGGAAWLAEHADEKGIKVFRWTIFETMQPCITCIAKDAHPNGTDADRTEVCKLWNYCHGERAKKSTGWLPLRHVLSKVRPLTKEALETQYLCERPLTEGRVLYNFLEDVAWPDGNLSTRHLDPTRPYIIGHDPSEGKIAYFVFLQMDRQGVWHAVGELEIPKCPDQTVAKEKLYTYLIQNGFPMPDHIISDPHRPDAISIMRKGTENGEGAGRCFPMTVPAPIAHTSMGKGDMLRPTLMLLRGYIHNGFNHRSFAVNPSMCPKLMEAIKFHGYVIKNGEITDKPSENFKDYIDALRYAFMWVDKMYGRPNYTRIPALIPTTSDKHSDKMLDFLEIKNPFV